MKKLNIILGFLVVIAAVTYFVFVRPYDAPPPPVLAGPVSDFIFTDTQGKQKTLADLKGKVWVADFIFTSCRGVCPMMTQKMASLYRSYSLENDVRFVSVSVDPETDTPEVLQKYAEPLKVDPEKWFFLTGDLSVVEKLGRDELKLGSADEPIFHSSKFVLLDRAGRVRGYYDADDSDDVSKLFHDVALVLKDKTL